MTVFRNLHYYTHQPNCVDTQTTHCVGKASVTFLQALLATHEPECICSAGIITPGCVKWLVTAKNTTIFWTKVLLKVTSTLGLWCRCRGRSAHYSLIILVMQTVSREERRKTTSVEYGQGKKANSNTEGKWQKKNWAQGRETEGKSKAAGH